MTAARRGLRLLAAALACLALPGLARGQDKPKEDKPKDEKPKVEVGGYLQVDYRRGDAGDQQGAPIHELNGRRARLSVAGKVSDRVSYAVVFQGDGLNVNSASALDASITVKLASWARVQAGQFKYDFDLQGRESAALLSFSDRPHVTQVVAGALNGASTPSSPAGSFRDRGVSFVAASSSDRLQGSLGLYQGNGRGSDNNSSFAPVLRLQGSPVKSLRLSGGFLYSDTVDTDKSGPGSFQAWTLGAVFEKGRTQLRGEYYGARRERSPSAKEHVDGFYVHGVQTIGKSFEVLARYELLKDPAVLAGGTLQSVDLGGRYYFARRGAHGGTSLLVNALLRKAGDGAIKGVTVLNDGRGAMLTHGEDVEPVVVARLQVQF